MNRMRFKIGDRMFQVVGSLVSVEFPNDSRIPEDYRGKKTDVYFDGEKYLVGDSKDSKELTGYAREIASRHIPGAL